MSDTTARLGLPLLRAGQAQKEMSHNEALALIDLLMQPQIVAIGVNAPPTAPLAGQCWIVGTSPTGVWTGRAGQLAGWTEGGWRFVTPGEGMAFWLSEQAGFVRYSGGGWTTGRIVGTRLVLDGKPVVGARGAAIAVPAGGSVIDVEARAALATILAMLRGHGLIET